MTPDNAAVAAFDAVFLVDQLIGMSGRMHPETGVRPYGESEEFNLQVTSHLRNESMRLFELVRRLGEILHDDPLRGALCDANDAAASIGDKHGPCFVSAALQVGKSTLDTIASALDIDAWAQSDFGKPSISRFVQAHIGKIDANADRILRQLSLLPSIDTDLVRVQLEKEKIAAERILASRGSQEAKEPAALSTLATASNPIDDPAVVTRQQLLIATSAATDVLVALEELLKLSFAVLKYPIDALPKEPLGREFNSGLPQNLSELLERDEHSRRLPGAWENAYCEFVRADREAEEALTDPVLLAVRLASSDLPPVRWGAGREHKNDTAHEMAYFQRFKGYNLSITNWLRGDEAPTQSEIFGTKWYRDGVEAIRTMWKPMKLAVVKKRLQQECSLALRWVREGTQSKQPGGGGKWAHVCDFAEKMLAIQPDLTNVEILVRYVAKHSNREQPSKDDLRAALIYRRRWARA